MKYLITLILTTTTLLAITSSVKIPYEQCMKSKYGHTLGGTLHSKQLQKKRILRQREETLTYKREEALKKLQKAYPRLNIEKITFVIKNCYGFYKSEINEKIYYFDPNKLTLITGN